MIGRVIIFILLMFNLSYPYCFDEASRMYQISPEILKAIARVESNMKADAINFNKNGSFDYGVMQINSSWYYELGEDRWMALADPCVNVKTGAMILSRCFKKYGYNWRAIDCYNKGSKAQERSTYIMKIYKQLIKAKSYNQ